MKYAHQSGLARGNVVRIGMFIVWAGDWWQDSHIWSSKDHGGFVYVFDDRVGQFVWGIGIDFGDKEGNPNWIWYEGGFRWPYAG
jgi:hypothetical protein